MSNRLSDTNAYWFLLSLIAVVLFPVSNYIVKPYAQQLANKHDFYGDLPGLAYSILSIILLVLTVSFIIKKKHFTIISNLIVITLSFLYWSSILSDLLCDNCKTA